MALVMLRATGPGFPYGTVLINIIGSFIIGWFAVFSAQGGRFVAPDNARAFVMAGLCGGFTTFSAFSLQTVELLRAGEATRALANVGASVALCLVATALGIKLGQLS
jgi:CrcB protein